jgi:hypothetical protein
MHQDNTPSTLVSFEEALMKFKGRYIGHNALTEADRRLEQVLRYSPEPGTARWPARTYLLTGPSGSGKSTALKRFCDRHPPVREQLRDHHPVVYLEVPAKATKKATMHALLGALHAGIVNARASEAALTLQLTAHLHGMGVRMLVLDEAQHLFDSDNAKFAWDTADWLKSLANAGIAVVVAGLPEAARAFDLNIQLKRRYLGRTELAPFDMESPYDREAWFMLVKLCADLYPLRNAGLLSEEVIAYRLHALADGCFGRLMDFLHMVGIEAASDAEDGEFSGLERGEFPELTTDLLSRSAERLRESANPGWVNIFDLEQPVPQRQPDDASHRKTRLRGRRRGSDIADAA